MCRRQQSQTYVSDTIRTQYFIWISFIHILCKLFINMVTHNIGLSTQQFVATIRKVNSLQAVRHEQACRIRNNHSRIKNQSEFQLHQQGINSSNDWGILLSSVVTPFIHSSMYINYKTSCQTVDLLCTYTRRQSSTIFESQS